MSARGAVLALLAAVALGGFVQETPKYWAVEDPDKWLGLIAKYTPSVTENASCNGYLSYAYDAVSAAADKGSFWWDSRLDSERGSTYFNPETLKPASIAINPDHSEHVNDYEISMTMAHEGLHWHYGQPAVINGKVMTKDEAETWIQNTIGLCYKEEEEEDEDDPVCGAGADCNGGGETPKPRKVCTEQQVYVRWTVWVFKWEVIGFEWAKAYDPLAGDGETREQALELVPIYRTWFEQEQRGEWQTETVCTTVSS